MAIWNDYPTSVSNANKIVLGKVHGKTVNVNRAYMINGQAYDHNTISAKKERAAEAFNATQLPEWSNPPERDFPGLRAKFLQDEAYENMHRRLLLHKNLSEHRRALRSSGFSSAQRRFELLNKNRTRSRVLENIASNRAALSSSRIGTYFARDNEMTDAGQIASARSAISHERRRREHLDRMGFRRPSAAENKVQQTNIERGIQRAIGGRSILRDALKGWAIFFGASSGIRMAKYALFGASFDASRRAQATSLSAAATGSTFNQVRTLGNVAKVLGGSESDAASLMGIVNALTSGANLGYGLGPLEEYIKFGANLYPGMSKEDAIREVANTHQKINAMYGAGSAAVVASHAGIPAPFIKAMEGGSEAIDEYIEKYGNPLEEDRQKELIDQQMQMNAVLNKINSIFENNAPLWTDQLDMIYTCLDEFVKAYAYISKTAEKIGESVGNFAGTWWVKWISNVASVQYPNYPIVPVAPTPKKREYGSPTLNKPIPPIPYDKVPVTNSTSFYIPGAELSPVHNLIFNNMMNKDELVEGVKEVIRKTNGHDAVINVLNEPGVVSEP